jgi:hypothetical protein
MQSLSKLTLMSRRTKNPLWYATRVCFSEKSQKATFSGQSSGKPDQMSAIFASDSTVSLIKKLFIYKIMASNLFINHALRGMQLSYKVMGRTLTNFLINSTAGSIFTSGETLQTL